MSKTQCFAGFFACWGKAVCYNGITSPKGERKDDHQVRKAESVQAVDRETMHALWEIGDSDFELAHRQRVQSQRPVLPGTC